MFGLDAMPTGMPCYTKTHIEILELIKTFICHQRRSSNPHDPFATSSIIWQDLRNLLGRRTKEITRLCHERFRAIDLN